MLGASLPQMSPRELSRDAARRGMQPKGQMQAPFSSMSPSLGLQPEPAGKRALRACPPDATAQRSHCALDERARDDASERPSANGDGCPHSLTNEASQQSRRPWTIGIGCRVHRPPALSLSSLICSNR